MMNFTLPCFPQNVPALTEFNIDNNEIPVNEEEVEAKITPLIEVFKAKIISAEVKASEFEVII